MDGRVQRRVRRLDLNKALGRRLASLRKEQGKRQIDVSAELGVQRPLVSKIENGHRFLSAFEIPDYARALGIAPEELLYSIVDVVQEYDGKLPEERESQE